MRAKTKYELIMLSALGAMAIVLSQTRASDSDQEKRRKSEPVAEHRNLDPLVGMWQITGQCFERSETSPDAVSGTDRSEWILGNRFVKCHVNGMRGTDSIEGIGMTGYDTSKNKYVSTWQDNKCNSIKMEEGTYDSISKTFTFTGDGTSPDGVPTHCRRVLKINSNDEHTMTAYVTENGKPEKKVAEMTFRRSSKTASTEKP